MPPPFAASCSRASAVFGVAGRVWGFALVVCGALLGSGAAHAERIAVLQIDAPGLLPGAREEIESQVRLGLKDAGLDVQDGARTAGFVADAVGAGLACSLADEDCALKVAVAADVDGVVIGRSVVAHGRRALELALVTLDGQHKTVAGSEAPRLCATRLQKPDASPPTPLPLPLLLEPADATLLVDGAAAELDDGVVWLLPGPHNVTVSSGGYDSRVVVVDVKGDRLPPAQSLVLEKSFPLLTGAGLVMAGGGVVVAGFFGLLAWGAEEELKAGVPRDKLDESRAFGQGLLVLTGLGVATVGVGAGLAVLGGLE